MADPAENEPENKGTGPENDSGVETEADDDFGSAFDDLAAQPDKGDPAPGEKKADEDGDEAGQDGAERGSDDPPSNGDDSDPPAKAPADKAAAGEEAPDPWANATPEQIAARDKLIEELDRTRASDEGSRRRASGLQRQLNALQSTSAAQPPQGKEEGKGEEPSDAKKALDAKIAQLKEDYPEVAGPLIELLEAQSKELADLHGKVAPVIEANQEETVAEQVKGLEAKHSDWRLFALESMPKFDAWFEGLKPEEKAINTNFRNWLADQPAPVQSLANSWDAREIAVALTLFKTEQAEAMGKAGAGKTDTGKTDATDAKRQRQLDGGKAVTSKAGSAATGAPDDFDSAFDHFSKRASASG